MNDGKQDATHTHTHNKQEPSVVEHFEETGIMSSCVLGRDECRFDVQQCRWDCRFSGTVEMQLYAEIELAREIVAIILMRHMRRLSSTTIQ